MGMQNHHLYPTDLTDAQWKQIEPMIPSFKGFGRPPIHPRRRIVEAILYLVKTGCQWRQLPHDFPAWQTVYDYFSRWRRNELWQRIHDILAITLRITLGRKSSPTAGIIDSQSVKIADQAGDRGFDAGKKLTGRKRHLLIDTLGLILAVVITPASVQDRDGARLLLEFLKNCFSRLKIIWADGGYAGQLVDWLWLLRTRRRIHLEIVNRSKNQTGFKVLPKRWIVERTFGWLMKCRRLRCDYEQRTDNSRAFIHIAMIRLMLRRIHA
jgi:putative transposase